MIIYIYSICLVSVKLLFLKRKSFRQLIATDIPFGDFGGDVNPIGFLSIVGELGADRG